MKYLLLSSFLCAMLIVSCGKPAQKEEPEEVQDFEQTVTEQKTGDTAEAGDTSAVTGEAAKKDNTVASGASDADKAPAEKPSAGKWTGTVHSISNLLGGNFQSITSDKAGALAAKGQFLVFKSGDKVYLVYNSDSYASKKLASVAGKTVTITGKMAMVNEAPVIFADNIE